MKRDWIRLHCSALNNVKVCRLTDKQFRAWTNCLLCVNRDGVVPRLDYLCWHLRLTLEETQELVSDLVKARLIDDVGGVLTMHDWQEYQWGGRPPAAEWRLIRERIFARDDYTCTYCDARGVALHCDHIHPVAHGGGHDDDNLVTACEACNRAKRSKIVSVDEWRAIRGERQ